MNDDRCAIIFGLSKRSFHVLKVVSINWTDVLDVEVWEDSLCLAVNRKRLAGGVHRIENYATQRSHLVEHALGQRIALAIPRLGSNSIQGLSQATDGRGIGAPIVIHHDDQIAVIVIGDVVQCLPCHSPGQRAITNDGNYVPVLLISCLEGTGDAISPRK